MAGFVTITEQDDFGLAPLCTKPNATPGKISLKDCLACSGCVTSAETVVLEQQNVNEFLKKSSENCMVTISNQSVASLAAHWRSDIQSTIARINRGLRRLGVKKIFDLASGNDLAARSTTSEFLARIRARTMLPLLTSSCPGWICMAEKRYGSWVLPYLSATRSPQQLTGALIRKQFGQVFHVTVAPCFDRKLEAVRDDSSIDLTLTTSELLEILNGVGEVDDSYAPTFDQLTDFSAGAAFTSILSSLPGGESDGLLHHAYMSTAVAFGVSDANCTPTPVKRSADCAVAALTLPDQSVLRFARVYGIRHLKPLLQKIQSGKCDWHFVEVMACDAGCVNGNGQVKPAPGGSSARETLQRVREMFQQIPVRESGMGATTAAAAEDVQLTTSYKNLEVMETLLKW